MLKRKQLLDLQEVERQEAGLEREDLEDMTSSSESDISAEEESEMQADTGADMDDSEEEGPSGSQKIKVMVLGSRGINSR
jgi:hypothetical protein